jgi:hypothetical protein
VDKRYELFCLADPLFYDSPDSSEAANQGFAAAPARFRTAGCGSASATGSFTYRPGEADPSSGLEVHVSACRDNAERLLGLERYLPKSRVYRRAPKARRIASRKLRWLVNMTSVQRKERRVLRRPAIPGPVWLW